MKSKKIISDIYALQPRQHLMAWRDGCNVTHLKNNINTDDDNIEVKSRLGSFNDKK